MTKTSTPLRLTLCRGLSLAAVIATYRSKIYLQEEDASMWEWRAASESELDNGIDFRSHRWEFWMYRSLLLANPPQVLSSLFDVQLNAMCMVIASMADWNSLAGHWKGFRVSKSHGEQCSTYSLSLFYRFAVPLILTSIYLQWLLSQTFSMGYMCDGRRTIPKSSHLRF